MTDRREEVAGRLEAALEEALMPLIGPGLGVAFFLVALVDHGDGRMFPISLCLGPTREAVQKVTGVARDIATGALPAEDGGEELVPRRRKH